MFDIKIKEVNYHYSRNCAGECPIVKAVVHIRDEDTLMVPIKRTWVFDVLSYANKGSGVRAIQLIIEELVKKMWTALHIPAPKERVVLIDMYLPEPAESFEMSYMNELFTKYLEYERFRDNYARMLCNSRFGLLSLEPEKLRDCYVILPRGSSKWETQMKMLENYIKTGKLEFVPNRDIRTYKNTDLADSIIDTLRYGQYDINMVLNQMKDRAKAKEKIKEYEKMKIEKVIFNDPATIVFWRDGSKTVVKAQDEPFDKEKGLAMAIAKKVYGNEGNYYNEFKKFIKDDTKEESEEKNE